MLGDPAPTSTCSFLQHVHFGDVELVDVGGTPHINGAPAKELGALVELLKCKQFAEALSFVRSGQVPVRSPFGWSGSSLLARSLHRSYNQTPVTADVEVLLDAVRSRGEVLDDEDLLAACSSAAPALVQLLLDHGAPLGLDALHAVFSRSTFPANELLECARVLLHARAQLDAVGSQGVTPLVVACAGIGRGKRKLQSWLLENRADPDGAAGRLPPLHALVGSIFSQLDEVKFLVEAQADVNRRDSVYGCSPLHVALCARCNLKLARELVALGADASIADNEGLLPVQLLIRQPQAAAELERRAMTPEEMALQAALQAAAVHPVAARFQRLFQFGWVLHSNPDGLEVSEDMDPDAKLSELLGGASPKVVELELALTRYSELSEHVALAPPNADGFTVRSVLHGIYEFYQEELSAAQMFRLKKCSSLGLLGDTFGYIRRHVMESGSDGEEAPKRQRSQRISLRGDSVYFEGFRNCMYLEGEGKLCGSMQLGS